MRLGIDLGGTTVGIGIIDERFQLLHNSFYPTAGIQDSAQLIKQIQYGIDDVVENAGCSWDDISFIGMGCPGEVDPVLGIGVYADNLAVKNTPFKSILSDLYHKRVQIDNDANCAAWGEHIAGVSKQCQNIVTVTLGTGIGGGVILDGKLLRGNENHAGEVGHIVVDIHGKRCGCGRIGCWETVASTRALIQEVERNAGIHPESRLSDLIRQNGGKANGHTLFQALDENDEVAKEVFHSWIRLLEVGMWNIINVFRPEMIVLSGGISNQGDTIIRPLREAVGSCSTQICAGQLGGNAGLIGAAVLDINIP